MTIMGTSKNMSDLKISEISMKPTLWSNLHKSSNSAEQKTMSLSQFLNEFEFLSNMRPLRMSRQGLKKVPGTAWHWTERKMTKKIFMVRTILAAILLRNWCAGLVLLPLFKIC